MVCRKRGKARGEKLASDSVRRANAHGAAQTALLAFEMFASAQHLRIHPLGCSEQTLSCRRQPASVRAPVKQTRRQVAFEAIDAPADGGVVQLQRDAPPAGTFLRAPRQGKP